MSDRTGPPTSDGVYDCLLDNGETVVLALESQAGTRTLRRPHARFEMCYLHEMEKRIVAHRPHTPLTPAPLKPLASGEDDWLEFLDIAWATKDKIRQALAAAEARAREAEGEAMKWRGLWSAYRQTEPQEQTRGVIFGELDHHWREVTDDPIAVEARAATSQLRELERQQLHAAQARIAELERERAALAERIRGIPLPYAVVPLNDAFQAALHAAAALVEQKARAAINPQPESERE
jgi:hypothetical protein